MRKLITLGILALFAITTGCVGMGKTPNPVDTFTPMDYKLECPQIEGEMIKAKEGAETHYKKWQSERGWNTGSAVVGAILFWPMLFAMDLSEKEEIEFYAYEKRFNYLDQLYADKDCDFVKPKIVAGDYKPTEEDAVEFKEYNGNEPWSGVWKVSVSDARESGKWILTQKENVVTGTGKHVNAKANGSTLTGWYPNGVNSGRNNFKVTMTSLKTFKGTIKTQYPQRTFHVKGERITPVPEGNSEKD